MVMSTSSDEPGTWWELQLLAVLQLPPAELVQVMVAADAKCAQIAHIAASIAPFLFVFMFRDVFISGSSLQFSSVDPIAIASATPAGPPRRTDAALTAPRAINGFYLVTEESKENYHGEKTKGFVGGHAGDRSTLK